jgi:hypothetical protein
MCAVPPDQALMGFAYFGIGYVIGIIVVWRHGPLYPSSEPWHVRWPGNTGFIAYVVGMMGWSWPIFLIGMGIYWLVKRIQGDRRPGGVNAGETSES